MKGGGHMAGTGECMGELVDGHMGREEGKNYLVKSSVLHH